MAIDPHALTLSAYDEARSHFQSFLRYGDEQGQLEDADQAFPWEDLVAMVAEVDGTQHAVAIYFGLEEDRLRFGLRALRLDPNGTPGEFAYTPALDTPQGARPSHLVANGVLVPIGGTNWSTLHDAYFVDVRVDRTGNGTFSRLSTSHDPKTIVLHHEEELVRMWNDDQSAIGGQPTRILLSSIALFHEDNGIAGPDGYRHGVSMHVQVRDAWGDWRDLLDDLDHGAATFQLKAADIGSMCPPRCKKFVA